MLSLGEILSYQNDRIINKFRTFYAVSLVEAIEISIETYKWLWLNAQLKEDHKKKHQDIPRILVVHEGMVVMDEFWHTFVLHTREYEAFCKNYLGSFIHHSPSTPNFQPPSLAETEQQLNYICDVLDEETMIKWYEEYPIRYSPKELTKLQKPRLFGQPCEATTS
jgi:hypothetical protein